MTYYCFLILSLTLPGTCMVIHFCLGLVAYGLIHHFSADWWTSAFAPQRTSQSSRFNCIKAGCFPYVIALDCSYELSKRPNSYITEWLGTSGSRKLGMDGSSCLTFNFTDKTTRFHTTIGGLDSRSFGVAQHSQPLSNKMLGEKRDVRSRRRFRPEFWKCFCVGSGLRRWFVGYGNFGTVQLTCGQITCWLVEPRLRF